MSKQTYNKAGVPWYCSRDTLPVRPRAIPLELPEHIRSQKASLARANQYVHKYFRENWKRGDRFVLSEPYGKYDSKILVQILQGKDTLWARIHRKEYLEEMQWITWTGRFIEKVESGSSYFIKVEFDDDQKHIKRHLGSRFGMYVFFRLAQHEES